MESTAALIPFDRLFKFSAEELNAEYRVNLFKKVKEENAELLGMFGDEIESEKDAEAEAETDGEGDEDEEEEHDEKDNIEEEFSSKTSKKSKPKKQNKKVSRKMRELEYDYEDPFIDDSEITDVYQSVFELMRGGGIEREEEEESGNEEGLEPVNKIIKKRPERNFFVYRGTMTPEILAKEFEIDVEELLEGGEGGEGDAGSDNVENGVKKVKKESKKRKTNVANGSGNVKKIKSVKEPKEPKKPKEPKEPKEPKTAKKKPSDLIAQSAKKFNDLFSSEDANEKGASASAASAVVFNVNGIDANLLELREVLKRFRDAAVGTPFSPGKFPSALRPRLNESICTVLRLCRPTPSALFPPKLFGALASFLPFSPAALNKLLTRKILGPLMEGVEKTELPRMYEGWRKMVEMRILEGGFIEVSANNTNVSNAHNNITGATTDIVPTDSQQSQVAPTQPAPPASPMKKRLKFSDGMRQQVFEIVRLESDLNNLICLSNFLESSNAAAASNENILNSGVVIRSVQSELNLRKNIYQKLMNLSNESDGVPLLSTTEISKEFGAQKRKHEKKVSKAASEILFGEGEVEEFLKELDVRKETVPAAGASAGAVIVGENPVNTRTTTEVHDLTNAGTADPLNLFTNDQSNTSLFIDSNQ